MQYISKSADDTTLFAENIAKRLLVKEKYKRGGTFRCVVALFGEMGAGKTAFVKGFARGAGYTGEVTSPTFALVHEYIGGTIPVYHFDMYRITGLDSLYSTGYYDYIDAGGFIITEWSENITEYIEPGAIKITIKRTKDESGRIITVEEDLFDENTGG